MKKDSTTLFFILEKEQRAVSLQSVCIRTCVRIYVHLYVCVREYIRTVASSIERMSIDCGPTVGIQTGRRYCHKNIQPRVRSHHRSLFPFSSSPSSSLTRSRVYTRVSTLLTFPHRPPVPQDEYTPGCLRELRETPTDFGLGRIDGCMS